MRSALTPRCSGRVEIHERNEPIKSGSTGYWFPAMKMTRSGSCTLPWKSSTTFDFSETYRLAPGSAEEGSSEGHGRAPRGSAVPTPAHRQRSAPAETLVLLVIESPATKAAHCRFPMQPGCLSAIHALGPQLCVPGFHPVCPPPLRANCKNSL